MIEWNDFEVDGKRLERIIKILFKHLKKVKSDEKLVRLSNSIAFITSKKMEVSKLHDKILWIEERIKQIEKDAKKMEKRW